MTASDVMKVNVMRLRLYCLALLLMLVVAACSPPPNLRDPNLLQDTSLLTDDPCAAPCWRNIIPGETSWRDMMIAIEDDPAFTTVEEVKDDSSEARLVNFTTSSGSPCCRVYSTLDGRTVGQILTLLAPGQMTLGDIFDKYGEPQYATGADVTSDQALVSLIYPDVPVIVYVFAAGVAEGALTAASEVIGVIYLQPADIDDIVNNTSLYAWEGYVPLAGWLDGNFDYIAEAAAAATAEATAETAP
ncbi:MAG: hypothetical protein MUE40_04630 [Anaerolineae bacterium]|nr:hypothetical protein [Anaerolineae bacterium]